MTIEQEEGDKHVCDQVKSVVSVLLFCNKFVFFNMSGNYK